MTHRLAVLTMVGATLLWSIAGVVTLQLESARSFEVTFWRSFFNAMALLFLLPLLRGPGRVWRSIADGGRTLWVSGLCWCVMFTAFMLAMTLTTVANVLVTMAISPLLTALIARLVLGNRLPARTWAAVVVAGLGIAWMYANEANGAGPKHLLGSVVALGVPVAAAINWTVIQANRKRADHDLLPAVLIGALVSALITLPLSLPLKGSLHDVGWLALLGVAQLAVPCLMSVTAARALSAPEVSLLGLLEIVFGVAWPWLGGREAPSVHVLGGGVVVLAALALNEAVALRRRLV
ncbi:MAG: DMT family transporter [Pseudomonadota bacterium]|nr:DMT family transporter [Pseudomonadota bacterium]